jgi:hypothetical protein
MFDRFMGFMPLPVLIRPLTRLPAPTREGDWVSMASGAASVQPVEQTHVASWQHRRYPRRVKRNPLTWTSTRQQQPLSQEFAPPEGGGHSTGSA